MPLTFQQKRSILQQNGYDPNTHYLDDTTGDVYQGTDPSGEVQEPATPALNSSFQPPAAPTSSALVAGGRAALASTVPTLASIGAGAGVGSLFAPGPGTVIGGLAAALGAGYGAHKLQEQFLPEDFKQQLARDVAEHPTATFAGGFLPAALTFNPVSGLRSLPALARDITALPGQLTRGVTIPEASLQRLLSAGVNVGGQVGIEGAQQLQEGELNVPRLLGSAAAASVFNTPYKRFEPFFGGRPSVTEQTPGIAASTTPVPVEAQNVSTPSQEGLPPRGVDIRENFRHALELLAPEEARVIRNQARFQEGIERAGPINRTGIETTESVPVNQERSVLPEQGVNVNTPETVIQKNINQFKEAKLRESQAVAEKAQIEAQQAEAELQATQQQNEQRKVDLAIGGKIGISPELPAGTRLAEKITQNQLSPPKVPGEVDPNTGAVRYSKESVLSPETKEATYKRVEPAIGPLAERRGVTIKQTGKPIIGRESGQPLLNEKGAPIAGVSRPGLREVEIGPVGSRAGDTPGHEIIGHQYVEDLKGSTSDTDKALAQRGLDIFKGAANPEELLAQELGKVLYGRLETNLHGGLRARFKKWYGDFLANAKEKFGGNLSKEEVTRRLATRGEYDAPYGTRSELLKVNPVVGAKGVELEHKSEESFLRREDENTSSTPFKGESLFKNEEEAKDFDQGLKDREGIFLTKKLKETDGITDIELFTGLEDQEPGPDNVYFLRGKERLYRSQLSPEGQAIINRVSDLLHLDNYRIELSDQYSKESALTPEDISKQGGKEFLDYIRSSPKGLTETAYDVGRGVKSTEDIAKLKTYQEEATAKAKASNYTDDGEVYKSQFFREAHEYATGTGSAGFGERKKNPEFASPIERLTKKEDPFNKVKTALKDTNGNLIVGNKGEDHYTIYNKLSQEGKKAFGLEKPTQETRQFNMDNRGWLTDDNQFISLRDLQKSNGDLENAIQERQTTEIPVQPETRSSERVRGEGETKEGIGKKVEERTSDESVLTEGEAEAATKPKRSVDSIFPFLRSTVDRVRRLNSKEGPKIAEAADKFFADKSSNAAEIFAPSNRAINTLSDKEQANVLRYLYDKDQGNTAQNLSPKEQSVADELQNILKSFGNKLADIGPNILDKDGFYRRLQVQEEGYLPNVIAEDVINTWRNHPNSIEAKKFDREWIDHAVDKGHMSEPEATKLLKEYKKGFSFRGRQATSNLNFGAIRKAAGMGIPFELMEKRLPRVFERYANRAGADLSVFQNLQSNPEVATALGMKDQFGKLVEHPGVEDVSGTPVVQDLLDSIYGVNDYQHNPAVIAVTRLFSNLIMGPGTAVRNIAALPAQLAPYIRAGQLPEVFKAIAEIRSRWNEAQNQGVIKSSYRSQDTGFDVPGDINRGIKTVNSVADFFRKYQGRDLSDSLEGAMFYSIGKELGYANSKLAANGDKQAIEFLNRFNKGKSTELTETDFKNIGTEFTAAGRTSYDPRQLPPFALRGQLAPFFQLSRFAIAKSNVIAKDVITPALNGDYKPLLKYIGVALGTGYGIEKLNELMSNRKPADANTEEVLASGNSKARAEKVVDLLQLSSFLGIVGDFAKLGMRAANGKSLTYSNPASFPLYTWITDTLGQNTAQAVGAIQHGEDPLDVLPTYLTTMMKQTLQGWRYVDNWANADESKRKDMFRDKRVYEELVGLRNPEEATPSNEFENLEAKKFRRTKDVGEAVSLLPGLISKAIEKANGDPYRLKAELQKLKQNNYQTIPSPERMPLEFAKFLTHLAKTQGSEEASKRLSDYFQQNTINQVKSSVVP